MFCWNYVLHKEFGRVPLCSIFWNHLKSIRVSSSLNVLYNTVELFPDPGLFLEWKVFITAQSHCLLWIYLSCPCILNLVGHMYQGIHPVLQSFPVYKHVDVHSCISWSLEFQWCWLKCLHFIVTFMMFTSNTRLTPKCLVRLAWWQCILSVWVQLP